MKFKPFTEEEAWLLFKLAAFAEAIGWTILIIGIFLTEYVLPGNRVPVVLAGRSHGILFGIYLLAVIVLIPSLRWKWPQAGLAILASIPPYGTLFFEIVISRQRAHQTVKRLSYLICYINLAGLHVATSPQATPTHTGK